PQRGPGGPSFLIDAPGADGRIRPAAGWGAFPVPRRWVRSAVRPGAGGGGGRPPPAGGRVGGLPGAAPMDTLGGEARVEEEAGDGATAPGAARRRAAAGAMTAARVEVRKGTYHDSGTLMQVSRQAGQLPGVEAAAAVAATPVNLELLARQG